MNNATRERYTQNSLDHFFTVYERNDLAERIGGLFETFGLASMANYTFNPENYNVIYPEEGVVDATEVLAKGRIPVVTLEPGELITVATLTHPLQSASKPVNKITQTGVANPDGHTAASVYTQKGIEDLDNQKIVHQGGPLFAINYLPETKQLGRTCPTVIGHELVHLAQVLSYIPRSFGTKNTYALRIAKNTVADELQAYAVQAAMFWETASDFEPVASIDVALTIEGLRRKVQKDCYSATKRMLAALRGDRIAARILPVRLRT